MTTEVKSVRRYYLLKRLFCKRAEDDNERVWQALQDEAAGDALPSTFPSREALVAAGYSTRQDLDGADEDELIEQVGLGRNEAKAVLAALAAL